MYRGLKKKQLIVMFGVSLLLAAFINYGLKSFAASAPKTTLLSYTNYVPGNGGSVTAQKTDNKFKAVFRVKANDTDTSNGLLTQVVYKKSTDTVWRNFGKTSTTGPDGKKTTANGITSAYVNTYGWNCAMGWSSWPTKPADCKHTAKSTNGRSGLPAWSDYPTYTPAVYLTPGTYYWRARSYDGSLYGSWTSQWSFKVNSYPLPTCALTASPTSLNKGAQTKISWSSSETTSITSSWGAVGTSGTVSLAPLASTTYAVTAKNGAGSKTCSVAINVIQPVSPKPVAKPAPKPVTTPKSSAPVSSQPASDKTPPGDPTGLKVEYNKTNGSISLVWAASVDDRAMGGYEIERKEKAAAEWAVIDRTDKNNFEDYSFQTQKQYEYRLRAIDSAGNSSGYSEVATVTTGELTPNVTVLDGGEVVGESGVTINFPKESVTEDIFVSIEEVPASEIEGLTLEEKTKAYGKIYMLRARNMKGEEVSGFKTQVTVSFPTKGIGGVNKKSLKITTADDEGFVSYLHSQYNADGTVSTLTDHFSLYFLTGPKANLWLIFLRVVLWIAFLGALGYGGYYGWQKYQLSQYQKEHREDYIYKH